MVCPVTQRVDRAGRSGLVQRLATDPGSRTVLVELTPEGHREVERAVGLLLSHEQATVDVLSPDEQAELAAAGHAAAEPGQKRL